MITRNTAHRRIGAALGAVAVALGCSALGAPPALAQDCRPATDTYSVEEPATVPPDDANTGEGPTEDHRQVEYTC
ncbi:hypothetical protein [Nocardia sp. NPDC050717]|uniref:hypothetical protein n=1 Tax=Nocardia sp. NPDC050717 TaxID=3157221 RepID=UPI0033C5F245